MDETLMAMNNKSMSEMPKSFDGQMSATLRGRELVNPSITQSAPEVNQNIDAYYSSPSCLRCMFSFTVLSLFPYFLVGGCKWPRKVQEEREEG